jgi:flagellar operon protein
VDLSKLGASLNPTGLKPLTTNSPGAESIGKKPEVKGSKGVPFSELLNDRLDGGAKKTEIPGELKFSAHAKTRLESRGIELNPEDLLRMQEAVQKAGEKGARESLILSDKGAFIVSVKNNTVITAVDKASLKENVFTNIDSTIMI